MGDAPVVFIGVATYDAIAVVSRFPGSDERVIAEDVALAGGGPAATAAVAAARLGLPQVAFIGALGSDTEARQIRGDLAAEGVDTTGVIEVPDGRSGAAVGVVDGGRATRALCTRPGPPLLLHRDTPQAQLIREAVWVHTDHVGWGPLSNLLADVPSHRRPLVSVDAGNPIDGFTPAEVDLYVPTVDALSRVYGDQPTDDLLAAALADGASTVVATAGASDTVAATGEGARYTVPAYRIQPHSTLGAGDVFHGALLAALVREEPLERSLAYANIAAGLSCRGIDGRSAIPTHDMVLAELAILTNSP